MNLRIKLWLGRLMRVALVGLFLFLFVVIPVGGSLLITNMRFPPVRSPDLPTALPVEEIEFVSSDGIRLNGWWSAQKTAPRGAIIFVHGLNRSRLEMLERAEAAYQLGFSILLFDLRNHGASADAYTTLGVRESHDACAAAGFVRSAQPDLPVVFWGVSLGASTALLGANCADATAVISDSSFLSFEETVKHHFRRLFRLPSFPIADLLILITRLRMDFDLEDGDVEAAVAAMPDVPVLFVAGGQDWRMPPDLARQLRAASAEPRSRMLVIEDASHGRAYMQDPDRYMISVMSFLDDVLPE